MSETYNGWKNYNTWAVNLWMKNTESSNFYWTFQAQRAPSVEALADLLKDYHEAGAPDFGASVYSDLLGYALQSVDWYEIAKYLFEEVGRGKG